MELSEPKVRIVGITQPKIPECGDAGELIAFAARVSNPKNQSNSQTAPKLLKYLADHHHWSPFECGHVLMEFQTTRDISRQVLRHRSFSFQEWSQRYSEVPGFVLRETRLQDKKNRQNSIECDNQEVIEEWNLIQRQVVAYVSQRYRRALDLGIAKEQARAILPEGLTLTQLYVSGSVRSWIHYCAVRTDPSTQKEHRVIAEICWKLLTDEFPALKGLYD